MNIWTFYLTLADLVYVVLCTGMPKPLDDKILKYEPVYYNREQLDKQCRVSEGGKIVLNFTAYNRDFNLILYRDKSHLSIKTGRQNRLESVAFIYKGIDSGYPESRVFGKITDGQFEGTIHLTDTEVYHVAPSHKHFTENTDFHSIIYAHHDYHLPNGYTDLTVEQPKVIRNSQQSKDQQRFRRQSLSSSSSSSSSSSRQSIVDAKTCSMKLIADHTVWKFVMNLTKQNEVHAEWEIIYLLLSHVEELNRIYTKFEFPLEKENLDDIQRVMKLQFYIKDIEISKDDCTNDEPSVDEGQFCSTRDPVILLNKFAESQYQDYDYYDNNYEGGGDAYNGDYEYNDHYDIKTDHCLVILFTARDLRVKRGKEAFPVLGAALPFGGNFSDGICQPEGYFAFITFCQFNEDRFLPPTVTQLVFAHEVTHTMGAPHDDNETSCEELSHLTQPDEGYYLMHSIAQIGRDVNNRKLSKCSMNRLVKTLSNNKYTECFNNVLEPQCGNRIVEEGEECDCGHDPCDDPCCHGYNIENNLSCKLKDNAQCSPSNGPCCDKETCSYVGRGDNLVCENAQPCVDQIYCNPSNGPCCDKQTCSYVGRGDYLVCERAQPCVDQIYCNGEKYGASCPTPSQEQVRPDGWHCSQYGRVCDRGSCNKSICDQISWRECQVSNEKKKLTVDEKEELCFLGCQPTKYSECVTSHNESQIQLYPEFRQLLQNMTRYDMPFSVKFPIGWPCNENKGYCDSYHRCRGTMPDTPLVLLFCWPCNENKGYCDSYHRCRGTMPDTPLVLLKNCFVNGDCLDFIKSNLWASILFAISMFVIIPVLLAKCCAIHTKSSNPILERKHPKQTVRESLHRISAIRESVNLETLQHSFHNMRNSLNLENFRHSLRRHSRTFSRQTSQNVPDVELNKLNDAADDDDCDKNEDVKLAIHEEKEALTKDGDQT